MPPHIEYYFNAFHGMVIHCRRLNQNILTYGEDELLNLLRNYAINARTNENLESQLDRMNLWCDIMPQIEPNDIDRNQNNRKFLRVIFLIYYRLLKRYMTDKGNVLDYDNPIIGPIRDFINQMTNDEKEYVYETAETDLNDEIIYLSNVNE